MPRPPLSTHLAETSLSSSFPCWVRSGSAQDDWNKKRKKEKGGFVVCYAGVPVTLRNVQWVSAVSSAVLMLAKGIAVQKSFLMPLLTLQAPSHIISWMKGEYGAWAAFLALLFWLFFHIPGELELPFMVLLSVIVAPHSSIFGLPALLWHRLGKSI